LTEEVGELAQVLNRIYDDSGEKEKHLANLRSELVDVYWLLNKIANKYDVELDIEVQDFVQRAKSGLPEKYRHELLARLQALDQELAVAKSALGQNLQRGEDKGCTV
jgi:NTP pyrophosphatase (non-canonical NTP hydrolase)